jgi:S1-C subfamily serine protease
MLGRNLSPKGDVMKPWRVLGLTILLMGVLYFVAEMPRPVPPRHEPASGSEPGVTRPEHIELAEASGPQALDPDEQLNVTVYKKALPSVVNITSTAVAFDFFYGPVPQQGAGSGFVIDGEGHILTNYHVIENARQVEVTTSDKKKYKAQIVGTDPAHDLAVIQIPVKDVPRAEIGDSKNLVVGQKVFAIGNPFGLSGTMTRGIISSIRSVRGPKGFIDEAIQTDAAINPGNSGGPLLNSRGQVIGINSMILTGGAEQSAGIGFAIPINTAKSVLDDLVHLGHARYPTLGVRTIPIGPDLADRMGLSADYGLLIVQVVPGSAADRAGLHGGSERAYLGNVPIMLGGDLIVAIDGQNIQDQQELSHVMQNHRAGDAVTLTVYRGKKRMDVKVVLGEARETA